MKYQLLALMTLALSFGSLGQAGTEGLADTGSAAPTASTMARDVDVLPAPGVATGFEAAANASKKAKGTRKPARMLARSVHYVDGGVRRTLWLDDAMLAEFDASRPGGRLVDTAGDDAETLAAALRSGASPKKVSEVLRTSAAEGSPWLALPGGVLVTFDAELDADARRALIEGEGLRLGVRLLETAPLYRVDTPAGLESLEIANRLTELGGVFEATPNFARENATR